LSTNSVKVGVIGCGFITQTGHLPSWLKCKNAKVVAVCDRNEERARKCAKDFKISNYYADSAEMLKREQLDMVDICTSTPTHAPLAIEAMELGCHVLTEKPMALNGNEADEMIESAEKNRVKLCVIHDMLFSLVIMRIRDILKQDALGNILRVEIKQLRPKDDPVFLNKDHWMHTVPGGIIIGDALIHPVYLARDFLGELGPVAAYTRKIGNVDHVPFDEIQLILKGEMGGGSIITSYNSPQNAIIIDIFGTEMNLHGELFNSILFKYKGPGTSIPSRALENLSRSLQILSSTVYAGAKMVRGKYGGHRILIGKFIESILNDTEPPVTANDGREVVRIVEKVVKLCENTCG